MKKTHLVSTGIILALLGSNIVIGNQYISDSKEYQSEIKVKNEIIKRKQVEIKKNLHDSTELDKENQDKIHDLSDELNKTKNDLNQLQQEKDKLDNQLKGIPSRKEGDAHQRKINVIATYYTAKCQGCSGTTATGINVFNTIYRNGYRIIAVDPSIIKLNSLVKVETETETFYAYAGDTGGAIKGHIIDVLVSNEKEALRNGRQHATLTIIKDGGV